MSFGDSINLGVDNAVQAIKDASGIVDASRNSKGGNDILPWNTSDIKSRFFQSIQIDANRWDQLFPYRLLVIDSKNNQVVFGNGGAFGSPTISVAPGTSSAIVIFERFGGWVFQLPISPQQLSIQDNYAIQTTATLRGVLEEHSGVRFKMINAQGTMGVWSQRSSVTKPAGTPGLIQSLFGGTIRATGNVIGQVNSLLNVADTKHPANTPVSLRPETSDLGQTSTGYYQALKLQQFLEQYAEAKKNPNNASWRLVFDIPKQNQSFIVTPVTYVWQQNVSKPMEVLYSFQLKAWRRIQLGAALKVEKLSNQPLSPGGLQKVLSYIAQARKVTSSSLTLIGSVRSDLETPLNILRQTTLLVKELAGVFITAADLPSQLVKDYKSSVIQSAALLVPSIVTFNSPSNAISKSNSGAATSNAFNSTSVASSDSNVRVKLASITASQNKNEGLSDAAVSGGQLGNIAAMAQSLDPVNNIFAVPEANFILLDQVPVSSLSLTNSQQEAVDNVVEQARQTTVATLKQYRAVILQLALQLSNSFGTGSAYYNQVYGLPPPTPRVQPITLEEYDVLKSLYDAIEGYDILTATTQVDDDNIETTMEYVAGLAAGSNIAFNIPNSKVLAPVPFGLTIEGIASRYLGDPQRWLEIATLNNLRDPYIDEDGFQYYLLSNANGRQIVVNSQENLFVGQKVIIKSSTQTPSGRTILNIDRLSDTSFLILLDGSDLDNFTTADRAYLQAYLPGTVNSQQKIFIPSDLPVPDDSSIIPPSATSGDPLTGLSKVDWLQTDDGDVAVNNYGDFRYSYGITNIIQALRIKFSTTVNTVMLHPNFGLNVKVGTISSELQVQELYNRINGMITQDPRFQGVSKLQITLNGPVLGISLVVQLPNNTGVFPVSFALTA